MCATSTVSARRGCVEEVQKVEFAGYVLLQTLILLYRLLEYSIGLRPPSDQIASAVRSDCVRRPIGLRSPPDRIAFAVRSDCVRHPVRLRPPSIRIIIECTQLVPSRIVIRIVGCCGGRRPPLRFFVCTDSLSSTAYCCRFAILCLRIESVSEAQIQIVVNIVCGVLLALEG